MEETIKELRIKVDMIAQMTTQVDPSAQMTKSTNSLFFAKAWMGKMLGAMNVPTPYKNEGARNSISDIEPTADRVEIVDTFEKDVSNVAKIDILRQKIGILVKEIEPISSTNGRKFALMKENVYTHLCESRFWLGFELERLRNEQEG